MATKNCFDIKSALDKMCIRLMDTPDDISVSMDTFFVEHEAELKAIQTPQSVRALIDIRVLCSPYVVVLHSPRMIAHFLRMTPLSNEKLRACAVCVGNHAVAICIQKLIDANPGKVPTFVSADFKECQDYLRSFL